MNEGSWREKNVGAPRRRGQSETVVRREGGARVAETRHWDGRQDAVVTPPTLRMDLRVHKTGVKRGRPAEVRRLSERESRERYGE